jgi:hypothetical protein
MSAQDRYTKIIESLVNGQEATASELLHEAFVEKAREIWSDLVEQDEIVEDDIAEEELEEAIGDEESGDFIDDIETSEEEIETEESFGEADEEDAEAEMDATGELADGEKDEYDFNMDGEMDAHEEEHSEVEQKLVSVEDALADLKATFAELSGLMGSEEAEEAGEEEGAEEEMGGEEEAGEEEVEEMAFEELDEAAELSKVNVTMAGHEDGKPSPVGPGTKEFAADKKPVDFAGGNEKGGKAPAPKQMGVKGPEAGAKMAPAPKPKAQ